ncbi:uncharacterized protein METZ01_LOCUS410956, partial [marine metagenome]
MAEHCSGTLRETDARVQPAVKQVYQQIYSYDGQPYYHNDRLYHDVI